MPRYPKKPKKSKKPVLPSNNGVVPAPAPGGTEPSLIDLRASTAQGLDMTRFALSQNFAAAVGAEKILNKIPVTKPHWQQFIRVHPGVEYQAQVLLLELAEEREIYLLSGEAALACPKAAPANLHLGITSNGNVFIWPVRLPGADGRINEWHESSAAAARQAMDRWVSIRSNSEIRGYDVIGTIAMIGEPKWPNRPFNELLYIAFRGRIIESSDHDILLRLNGQK